MSKQNFGKSDCGNQWSFTKMIYCDKVFICQEDLILFYLIVFAVTFCYNNTKIVPLLYTLKAFSQKFSTKYSYHEGTSTEYGLNSIQNEGELNHLCEPLCKQIILSETCMVWNPMQTMCNKISLFEWLRTLSCIILYKRTWKYFEYSI